MTNRRKLLNDGGGIPGKEEAVAGDILCAKEDGSKMIYKAADYANISSDWTPIGVIVIPPSHNVYGTGEGAAVSINYMDYSTPDEGSISDQGIQGIRGICYGQYGKDTDLPNFDIINNTNNNATPTISISTQGFLPSDNFSGTQCTLDPVAYYDTSSYLAPSPYLEDGSRYEGYYTNVYDGYNNVLSDFDGVGNTNYLCSIATAQSDWKTASTITNEYTRGYSPAACCCWRYHTTGTNQGDWYLPAAGEQGYLMARLKTINTSMKIVGGITDTDSYVYFFWSSTEVDNISAHCVFVDDDGRGGFVNSLTKYSDGHVRSFIRF